MIPILANNPLVDQKLLKNSEIKTNSPLFSSGLITMKGSSGEVHCTICLKTEAKSQSFPYLIKRNGKYDSDLRPVKNHLVKVHGVKFKGWKIINIDELAERYQLGIAPELRADNPLLKSCDEKIPFLNLIKHVKEQYPLMSYNSGLAHRNNRVEALHPITTKQLKRASLSYSIYLRRKTLALLAGKLVSVSIHKITTNHLGGANCYLILCHCDLDVYLLKCIKYTSPTKDALIATHIKVYLNLMKRNGTKLIHIDFSKAQSLAKYFNDTLVTSQLRCSTALESSRQKLINIIVELYPKLKRQSPIKLEKLTEQDIRSFDWLKFITFTAKVVNIFDLNLSYFEASLEKQISLVKSLIEIIKIFDTKYKSHYDFWIAISNFLIANKKFATYLDSFNEFYDSLLGDEIHYLELYMSMLLSFNLPRFMIAFPNEFKQKFTTAAVLEKFTRYAKYWDIKINDSALNELVNRTGPFKKFGRVTDESVHYQKTMEYYSSLDQTNYGFLSEFFLRLHNLSLYNERYDKILESVYSVLDSTEEHTPYYLMSKLSIAAAAYNISREYIIDLYLNYNKSIDYTDHIVPMNKLIFSDIEFSYKSNIEEKFEDTEDPDLYALDLGSDYDYLEECGEN